MFLLFDVIVIIVIIIIIVIVEIVEIIVIVVIIDVCFVGEMKGEGREQKKQQDEKKQEKSFYGKEKKSNRFCLFHCKKKKERKIQHSTDHLNECSLIVPPLCAATF